MRASAQVTVAAPVERVWSVVTDHEGMSAWSPGVSVTLERPGEPDGAGAVRVVRMAGLRIREQVTAAERHRFLRYRCLSGLPLRDYQGEVTLRPTGSGTRLTWTLSANVGFRPLAALLAAYARIFATAARRAAERPPACPPVSLAEEPLPIGSLSDEPQEEEEPVMLHSPLTTEEPAAPAYLAAATMAEAFQLTAGRDPGGLALSTPDGAATLTWAQYASQVRALAAALHAHGVRSGETVALMMANRPDFHVADTAAMHLGVASFSVYNTSSPAQVRFLLASARPRVVICDAAHAPRVLAAVPGSTVEHVVCIDGAPAGTVGLAEFISVHAGDFDFEAAWRAVRPSDVLTLIYTSGTTGQPKGVQITHENMLAEIAGTQAHLNAGPGDRVISFLPSAHIADRWAAQYLQVTCGTTVYPLADRTGLLTALTQVQPTMFGAVPQAWQKIRAAVTMMIDGEPDQARKDGIARAIKVGAAYVRARGAGTVPEDKEVAYRAADAVLRPIRSRLGLDQARIVMSGAAPIPPDVVEFFNALGIPLIDGWGMSELSCLAAFMPADRPRLGSVGKPLLGTQIRVLPDGEILVRGPIVMKGYLGLPQLTAEVLDADGWLHTGDIGRIDQDGYLFIVDRKKELLVTATGENLSPSAIEGRLKAATPLIGQAVVIGDKRPYVTALIVLDPDAAAQYVAARSLEPDSEALAGAEEVIAVIASAVDAANAAVAPVEHVRKFAILPEFWVPGSDVLTHTMKPRRRPIAERYGDVIDALYALPHDQSILHVRDVRDRTTAQA